MDLATPNLPTRIEAERLYLRFYHYTDSAWYYQMALRNKAHLLEHEPGNAIFCIHNEEEAEAMLDHFEDIGAKRKEFYLGVFLKGSDEFVGQVFLGLSSTTPLSCSLGYFAECSHQGKGYLTEAVRASLHFIFNKLGAYRATLDCEAGNMRSRRLAERCGFEQLEVPPNTEAPGLVHYHLPFSATRLQTFQTPQYS